MGGSPSARIFFAAVAPAPRVAPGDQETLGEWWLRRGPEAAWSTPQGATEPDAGWDSPEAACLASVWFRYPASTAPSARCPGTLPGRRVSAQQGRPGRTGDSTVPGGPRELVPAFPCPRAPSTSLTCVHAGLHTQRPCTSLTYKQAAILPAKAG